MTTLGDIVRVERNITKAPVKAARTLHRIVFNQESDRQNRKRLRQFEGFTFKADSDEYKNKVSSLRRDFEENDLVATCSLLCLDYSGEKRELANRIIDGLRDLTIIEEAAKKEEDEDEIEEDDEEEPELEVEENRSVNRVNTTESARCRFSFSFRDIENAVRQFDGETGLLVRKWIEEFEDTATLLKWDKMQKLVFGKKSLTGLVKLYMQSETGITTWRKLRKALIEEFDVKITDADIHRQLAKRRRKKEESIQQYFLIMKEIASKGNITDDSLIEYVINGIDDEGTILINLSCIVLKLLRSLKPSCVTLRR